MKSNEHGAYHRPPTIMSPPWRPKTFFVEKTPSVYLARWGSGWMPLTSEARDRHATVDSRRHATFHAMRPRDGPGQDQAIKTVFHTGLLSHDAVKSRPLRLSFWGSVLVHLLAKVGS